MKHALLIQKYEEIRHQWENNGINLNNDKLEICLITSIYNANNGLFKGKFENALDMVKYLAPKYHNDPLVICDYINDKLGKYLDFNAIDVEEIDKNELATKIYNELYSTKRACVLDPNDDKLVEINGHAIAVFGMKNGKNSVLVNYMIQNAIDKYYNRLDNAFLDRYNISGTRQIRELSFDYMDKLGLVKTYHNKFTMIHQDLFDQCDALVLFKFNRQPDKYVHKLNCSSILSKLILAMDMTRLDL